MKWLECGWLEEEEMFTHKELVDRLNAKRELEKHKKEERNVAIVVAVIFVLFVMFGLRRV